MKYIYIAGLEHSGTTLLSQILANGRNVLALGEVGQFLSQDHMHTYMARWGEYPDVRRCSCGADWARCEFWSQNLDLCGLEDMNGPDVSARYRLLLERLSRALPDHTIIDSSKSLPYLHAAWSAWKQIASKRDRFLMLLIYKDARAFAYSQGRKGDHKPGLFDYYRWTNLWAGAHEQITEFIASGDTTPSVIAYSDLCSDPRAALSATSVLDAEPETYWSCINHRSSHIAMGNKDFAERNRLNIREDIVWKEDARVKFAYALNRRAQKVADKLKSMS